MLFRSFKHGIPIDADLVFDVRFLINPHYRSDMRKRTGRDRQVSEYVHSDPRTRPFQERMNDLIMYTLPEYQKEGKAYVNIAIGCTGGHHRSVALAEELAGYVTSQGFNTVLRHRDIHFDGYVPPEEIEA